MTKKRIKENLEYITQIEQDMLSKGKRIAPRLYVVKRDLQKALGYEVAYWYEHLHLIAHAITMKMPLISDDNKFPPYRKEGLELIEN